MLTVKHADWIGGAANDNNVFLDSTYGDLMIATHHNSNQRILINIEDCGRNRLADFPEPTDVNVNMMPFKMLDKDILPSYLAPYWHMIRSCPVSPWCSVVGEPCLRERIVYHRLATTSIRI